MSEKKINENQEENELNHQEQSHIEARDPGKNLEMPNSNEIEINEGMNEQSIKNESADEAANTEENSETHENQNEGDSESRFQEFFSEIVEKRGPKITDTLLTFVELKNIDEELADIDEEKGDLPESIETILEKINSLDSELNEKKESLSKLGEEKAKLEKDDNDYEAKINKYDEQKFNVRNNTEYDEIVRAIESLFDEVKKNETRLKSIKEISDMLEKDVSELDAKAQELRTELSEKQTTLDELNEQYKQDEIILKEKRQALVSKIDEASTSLYERINKSCKGEATAIVRKGNCSGCYNSIPPQRVIEIKAAEKIFTCQSCGRILIPGELVAQ